jgi:hypothetical protein
MKTINVSNANWLLISRGLKIKKPIIIFFLLLFSGHVFSQTITEERKTLAPMKVQPNPEKTKMEIQKNITYSEDVHQIANKIIVLTKVFNDAIGTKEKQPYSTRLLNNSKSYPFSTFEQIEKYSLLGWINSNQSQAEQVILSLQLFIEETTTNN